MKMLLEEIPHGSLSGDRRQAFQHPQDEDEVHQYSACSSENWSANRTRGNERHALRNDSFRSADLFALSRTLSWADVFLLKRLYVLARIPEIMM